MTDFTKGLLIVVILIIMLIVPSVVLTDVVLARVQTELLLVRELLFGAATYYLIKSQTKDGTIK